MLEYHDRLADIAALISKGIVPPAEPLIKFLSWFGVTRRGWRNVQWIKGELSRQGLDTSPDCDAADYDGWIRFVAAPAAAIPQRVDPTVRLSELRAANRLPVTVSPTATLESAVSLMLTHDYSQLPVVTTLRDVKGLISWRSVASRLALGKHCTAVNDCMDPARILPADSSLYEAVRLIAAEDCILVHRADRAICGIVTATDINEQFMLLAEPFLLVGEIEKAIRNLIIGKFSAQELQSARLSEDTQPITSLNELTFGEYVRLLENPAMWSRLKLRIDRKDFCERLDRVRQIRNDIMHFSPNGSAPEDTALLREFATLLRRLRQLDVVA